MLIEKPRILIQFCEESLTSRTQSETSYDSHFQEQVKKQIHRLWKNIRVQKNSSNKKAKFNSFQVLFENVLIFSKLRTGCFPKNQDIMIMIMGLEKSERESLQKLKYKLEILKTDLYSILLDINKGKMQKVSLKTIRSFLDCLKPALIRKRKQTKLKKIILGRGHEERKKYNRILKKSSYEDDENTLENLSLRLNTQSTVIDMQRSERSNFYQRISGFKDVPNFKKIQKYGYLPKQMDIQVEHNEERDTTYDLDELSEDESQSKRKITQKTNSREKIPSNRRKSFLTDKMQQTLLKEKNLEEKSQEYQINVNWVNNSAEKPPEDKEDDQLMISQKSIYAEKKIKAYGEITKNEKYFRIDPDQILVEFKTVNLSEQIRKSDMDYLLEKMQTVFHPKDNIVENILMYVYMKFPSEIQKIFQYDIQSMIEKQEMEIYSPILFNRDIGKFQAMVINHEFPAQKQRKKFIYQNPIQKQCWPLILEKALAKIYKGYVNLYNKIKPQELLKILTGVPLIIINTADIEKIQNVIGNNQFKVLDGTGRMLCVRKQGKASNILNYFPEVIQFTFDLNILSWKVKVKIDENLIKEYTYEQFSLLFEKIIIFFYHQNYIHNQLHMNYTPKKLRLSYNENGRCETDPNKRTNWKILLFVDKKTHSYIEFTEKKKTNKTTTIKILKMNEKNQKTEKQMSSKNLISSKQLIMGSSEKKIYQKVKKSSIKLQQKTLSLVGEVINKQSFFFQTSFSPGFYVLQIIRLLEPNEENCLHTYSNEQIQFKDSVINGQDILGLRNNSKIYFKSL